MGRAKPPTVADRVLWERLRALGCVTCGAPASIHHCFTGMGGRKDHRAVLPLCHFHHQGEDGIHTIGRRKWQERHGSEQELLERVMAEVGL